MCRKETQAATDSGGLIIQLAGSSLKHLDLRKRRGMARTTPKHATSHRDDALPETQFPAYQISVSGFDTAVGYEPTPEEYAQDAVTEAALDRLAQDLPGIIDSLRHVDKERLAEQISQLHALMSENGEIDSSKVGMNGAGGPIE